MNATDNSELMAVIEQYFAWIEVESQNVEADGNPRRGDDNPYWQTLLALLPEAPTEYVVERSHNRDGNIYVTSMNRTTRPNGELCLNWYYYKQPEP